MNAAPLPDWDEARRHAAAFAAAGLSFSPQKPPPEPLLVTIANVRRLRAELLAAPRPPVQLRLVSRNGEPV